MRDDYALRSMAQTRALSKCLRAPLGFIIQLAGFAATPAEEIPDSPEPEPVRQEGPPPYPVPQSWSQIEKAFRHCDNSEESWALAQAFIRAASYHLFGEADSAALETEQRRIVAQKAATVAVALHDEPGLAETQAEFIFFTEDAQRKAWSKVLDGALLEIPDYVPPLDREAEQMVDETADLVPDEYQ
jgi:hypothetical protein